MTEQAGPTEFPPFRLTPAERERVHPYFDADALERLLSMLHPDTRAETLARFQHPGEDNRIRLLTQFGDATLQTALEEVWQPYWAGMSAEEMEREPEFLPGRELVRRRSASEA